jgi:hypothetical protein
MLGHNCLPIGGVLKNSGPRGAIYEIGTEIASVQHTKSIRANRRVLNANDFFKFTAGFSFGLDNVLNLSSFACIVP